MDFSEEWKSQFSVGSVFPCPRLITGESAHSLGPLCFSPINLATHFLSLANTPVCYSPPPTAQDVFSTADCFYRRSDDDFIPFPLSFSTTKSAVGKHSSRHFSGNPLHLLTCRNGESLILFPSGENSDPLTCVVGRRERDNGGGFSLLKDSVFLLSPSFKNRIIRVSVISTAGCASSSEVCDQFTEGFVLLCSHYEVHQLRVGVRNSTPLSQNLASATFKNQVAHACWSPYLLEESAVLLVNGELRLYDLNYCVGVKNLPVKFKGELVSKNLGSLISRESDNDWFCCKFGWHPRVLIVTSKTTVWMVDFRTRRKPLDPVLQWDHHLNHVRYINMYRLSDLRPSNGKLNWASDSGYVILVGSFRNCEFSLFCYGPHPIVDLKPGWTSDSGSLYAWGLPSEIALVSQDCCCVDCELEEEFRTDSYTLQKCEKGLGFCVRSEPCSERYEDDCTSGFFMIRLTCNGIFETLKYQALWDFSCVKSSCKPVQVQCKTTFPSHVEPEDIDHLKLLHKKFDYFLGYFSGGPTLAEVLNSRLEETSSRGSMHCNNVESTEAAKELILEAWKASGQVEFGSLPSMDYVLGDINTPSSAHEIISKRMWTGLNLCYVELAFVRNSDLNHTGLDFLAIPSSSSTQLPPFPFRVPSKIYGRSHSKATKKCDQVGPPTEKGDVIDLVPPHLVGCENRIVNYKDNIFDIFITALHKKNCDPRGEEKLDASELFDELSPVKLNFDSRELNESFDFIVIRGYGGGSMSVIVDFGTSKELFDFIACGLRFVQTENAVLHS
ncbi:uncharacterized protein LOC18428136 [Amborella trichopoda]|uniref:uncharacterized protein LOC18428136 n=1 Tax=Amborella trichopoda TaxID=13333 RepID=UPI0009BE7B4F|nr:uncharacterized protein LOC18428136 [Amborella trichopoda]|eukprot:XP_020519209.1 uncharacterized protein LOC18428136 [Amborella trichopoda]